MLVVDVTDEKDPEAPKLAMSLWLARVQVATFGGGAVVSSMLIERSIRLLR